MSFGCGVTAAKLAAPGAPRSKNSIPYDKACEEFGDERASVSDNLDASRSHLNTYSFPEGCGTSGAALADWFVKQRDEYSAKRQKEGGRKLSALAPVGGAFIITPDEEEVATWDARRRKKFIKDALESLGVWMGYGKEHKPDAYAVHVDEGAMFERGLTRADELGDEGLHIHVADRMLTEDGRYLSRETMSPGRIREMHRVFVREMKSRGWDITEHKSAAQHKRDGDEVLPAGMSANKFKRVRKWEAKKKRELESEREGLDADKSQLATDQATLAEGQSQLAEDQATLAEGQSQLADDREALESDRKQFESDRTKLDDDREQLGLDRQALEDAQARLKADEDAHAMRVMRSHRALNRARAANAIDREGWEPPTTAKLFMPAQLSGNALALWKLVYEGDGSGLTGDWADLSQYEDENGELDVEEARALLDTAMTGALGGDAKGCAVTSAEGAWWVTDVPESARDELYESDRAEAIRRYARDVLEPRLLVLNERGEDVNEPQQGVEGTSDLIAQCIRQLEVDNKALDERKQTFKREAVAHEVGYFPAVDAEGKDTIIALSVTDKGRADLTNPETRIETANRLLLNIRETHPVGTQAKDGRTVTGEFVPGYLFREAAAAEREREAEQVVSEARAVVDASRRHDAEVEDWWADAKRTLRKSAQQLAKDVHRFLGKAARQFQSSRSDLVRGIGETFAKAAYQWGIHISSAGAFANNPALAQIFDDDDHDEWRRVEEAKPASLDDELMGVFDEMHGHKSSTGKARANAQTVQAQRVSFAERWGVDIDDVDTTPSTADYDEPDF